jgi:expansin (peptidoglycan-binding protein)
MAGVYTNLVPVVSSNLKAAGWVQHQKWPLLEIEFLSDSLYLYINVPKSAYDELMAAPSKGKYFWANIRCKTTDCSGGDIPYQYYKLR